MMFGTSAARYQSACRLIALSDSYRLLARYGRATDGDRRLVLEAVKEYDALSGRDPLRKNVNPPL